jgi:hypothetical protein
MNISIPYKYGIQYMEYSYLCIIIYITIDRSVLIV